MPNFQLQNRALEIVMEFGPRRQIAPTQRIQDEWPLASQSEIDAAISVAQQVERRAYELTKPCWPTGTVTDAQFKAITANALEILCTEHPSIEQSALSHALSQAHYWHFRD